MEEQKPYDRFRDIAHKFSTTLSSDRHFGQIVLGQNGHRPATPVGPFAVSDPNGISLVRLVIEKEGALCGMMTSIELKDGSVTLVIYEPERTTEVIPLERLRHFSLERNYQNAFCIENELLVKRNGQRPPTPPEGLTDESGPTPHTATETAIVSE